jgi:hypothetical protein
MHLTAAFVIAAKYIILADTGAVFGSISSDFLRYRCWIFSKPSGDFFKRHTLKKGVFDKQSVC